ncbi:protein ANTAGONIST OF LIKE HETEROCHROMATIN PROTEIN 1-like [Acipenser oxyrinchus oxyrinchus]|uniref:Protein ANTAGONIST OF LIKE HETEROCHROMATIN PROTEIN 1-like n=1 Tax=Acipenser oxyrinchus oxyrinchus TaxID=40147 RepID=A0AAD8CJC8_ACIOX|nr:protein ANTAGONIST OF LIKE HETEROCHROMATIN PROTEIN 1-like [Acipenser oxyrinchus oxyrinchus]KAK1156984.1 protein ANTAGONIST OF LIKE HETEROCHROMATIN PROTEIN 1-like [Acipenser oxyrinchus oxyrinchus]
MAGDEALQPAMFMLLYMLMKRRSDINNANVERRNEIQRRVRHRQYFFQRQRRILMMLIARSSRCTCCCRTRAWTNIQSTDWWERVVMNEFEPCDWLEKFRMSKDTFFFICNKLKPKLARQDTHFRPALPLEKRVAVALWRLATNVEYRTISVLFGVGRSTVCKCVRDVCHAIVSLLKPLYLQEPSEHEFEDMARLFNNRWGFPHCVGAVDSLHLSIIAPPQYTVDYWNSKCWHSVVLQGVVNGLGQFWDVCAGMPGSTEDVTILQNSTLWGTASEGGLSPEPPRQFMGRPLKYFLLGDAAYPLQSWLLKPYPESRDLTPRQLKFNYRLNRARSVIENAFLRLKARWQCLHKRNDCSLDLVPTMILACCILHNMCEVHSDTFNEEWLEAISQADFPQPCDIVPENTDDPEAEEVRSLLCDYFQQQQE